MRWWQAFAEHDVPLVLTGHEHDYQRWLPMDGQENVDPGGVTEIVAGTGGHGITPFVEDDDRLAVGFDEAPDAYGALRLELSADGATYEFENIFDQILDSGSVTC